MAKKQIVTITDLVVQNPALQASLSKFENVKQQLDERAKQCLLIKVTDESSLSVCENNMAKMNDLIKEVESVHKEVKKPHWDNCNAIDAAKNYVLNFEINPVDYLKSEKVNYIKAIEAEAKRKADLEVELNEIGGLFDDTRPVEIKRVRRVWKFEVISLADVPREFLMIDESKVKQFMESKKDTLVDGGVVNGIKFFKEIYVTV